MNKIISCCGVICSKCEYYPIDCKGYPIIKGQVFWLEYTGEKICGMSYNYDAGSTGNV